MNHRHQGREELRAGNTRSAAAAVCVALAILFGSAGCFEEPVKKTLKIEMLADDRARITARTEVTLNLPPDNEAARTRAESARVELRNQTDPWSVQFRGLEPIEERYVLERAGGILTMVERSAIVERSGIEAMFRGSSISLFVDRGENWGEITIYPGESNRATKEQRTTLERMMRAWSSALEDYFASLERVVAHVTSNPDRRKVVWEAVFDDLADGPGEEPTLTSYEMSISENLSESIETTLEVFAVQEEQAYSLQEIGYLVYDPFPSEIRIDVPGTVIESSGFARSGETLEIRRVGLWEAFSSLRRDTVVNDPLTAWMGEPGSSGDGFDLDRFLDTPVSLVAIPDANEIIVALEEKLRPDRSYHIRWSETPAAR